MVFSDKGVALVNVVVILTVLLTLAQVLFEKVWMSTRQVSRANSREQLQWAAQSGIETARAQLARTYASSLAWGNYLTSASGGAYPSAPAWTTQVDDISIDLFLKDNPDGDQDDQADNDLKLFVLARATNAMGQQALVEALCGMDPPGSYGLAGTAGRLHRHFQLSDSTAGHFRIIE